MSKSKQYEDALAKFLEDGGKVEVCPPRRAAGLSLGKLRSKFPYQRADNVKSTTVGKRKAWKGARAKLRD
jgi:hypothetical protein